MLTKNEIGENIKNLRIKAGLSQKELGDIINRSHAAISDIERGKTGLSVIDLLRIAKSLKTPVVYILNLQAESENITIQYSGQMSESINSEDLKVTVYKDQKTVISPINS